MTSFLTRVKRAIFIAKFDCSETTTGTTTTATTTATPTTTSITSQTATTTATTTPTTTPCAEYRADLVFVVDTSPSSDAFKQANDDDDDDDTDTDDTDGEAAAKEGEERNGTEKASCNLRSEIRAFMTGIVGEIADIVSKDLVRVSALTFSNVATVQFNFNDNDYDPSNIQKALAKIPFDGGVPTYAHTAFELLDNQVLEEGSSNGFRHFAAPVIIVVVTDGRTMIPQSKINKFDAALNAASLNRDDVQRHIFSVAGVDADVESLAQMAGPVQRTLLPGGHAPPCSAFKLRLNQFSVAEPHSAGFQGELSLRICHS